MNNYLDLLSQSGAFLKGHFLLSSGLHSDAYIEKFRLLEKPKLTELFALSIAQHFRGKDIDLVVGPLTGGILIAHEVAKHLDKPMAFPERVEEQMQWKRGFEIRFGQKILLVEDVITTGKSVAEVHEAVTRYGGVIQGIGCFIQRGPCSLKPDPFAVVKLSLETYTPENCPLCARGIPLEKRGSRKI